MSNVNDISNRLSALQLQNEYLNAAKKVSSSSVQNALSFQEILEKQAESASDSGKVGQTGELKFSKHAIKRLEERNISMSSEQMDRLYDGAVKAGEKGIQESLVIVDELAFIVNIPNQTVITAMDQTESNNNVFTNIDGAVIM